MTESLYKSATAALISNVFGMIIGHPIDTLRVRRQVSNESTIRVLKTAIKNEGAFGLFKGVISPLVGLTPNRVLVFTVVEGTKRKLPDFKETTKCGIAGMVAGVLSLTICVPIEVVKCRAQVNKENFVKYRTAIPQLIKQEGPTALYKGLSAQFIRDVPGWGVYFYTYAYLQQFTKTDSIPERMLCGGFSG